MTLIKNYNYSQKNITAIEIDTNGYLWVAFAKNTSGYCVLQKVSAHNPLQVYYNIELSVDEITALHIFGSYLYVAVDDDTYLGYKYSLTSPLTVVSAISIPTGITEAPIDILDNHVSVFYLFPGTETDAKILEYTTSLALNNTIDLTSINNVKSFTIDASGLIWCVTYESPSKLLLVYNDGSGYDFITTILEG